MKGFLIGAVVVLFIGFAWWMDKQKTRKETIQAMDSLYEAKKKIINYDSIESSIRNRVLDTVNLILKGQNKRLNLIESRNDKLRKDNEDRFKRYDSINLRRPDF